LVFIYSDILYIYKNSYIAATVLCTVILHKYLRHIEETACKVCGAVWDVTSFLQLYHLVMSIFSICNSFALKRLIPQLIMCSENI